MGNSELDAVTRSAVNKASLLKNHPGKYFMSSIMAGFYIIVATELSNVSAAVLYAEYPEFGKLLGAFLFSLAIILVVFIGGELFTGNNFVMAMGYYNKAVSFADVIKVWVVSYIGNFVGAFFMAWLFVISQASHNVLVEYYKGFIYGKLSLTPTEFVVRGILCNFLVCMAVLVGVKLKTESGKLIVMFCVIMTFVLAGFEHCIANMGTFSVGYMLLGDIGTANVIQSMIFVTIGNIIGGAVLLAVPLKLMEVRDN